MKVGDLVTDKYPHPHRMNGIGLVIKEHKHHIQWDGASVCEVFWSKTGHVGLRRTSYLKKKNEE